MQGTKEPTKEFSVAANAGWLNPIANVVVVAGVREREARQRRRNSHII